MSERRGLTSWSIKFPKILKSLRFLPIKCNSNRPSISPKGWLAMTTKGPSFGILFKSISLNLNRMEKLCKTPPTKSNLSLE